jgi:heme-degrading monooxygenase HmoA
MIYEILTQYVQPEKRDEYIQVFGDILKKAKYAGSHGINFFTSIEDPSRVIVTIEWDSVEAHTRHRGTPTHNAMREATARYQTQKSDGGHFVLHEVKS